LFSVAQNEAGNPIQMDRAVQYVDENGNPIQFVDKFGNPVANPVPGFISAGPIVDVSPEIFATLASGGALTPEEMASLTGAAPASPVASAAAAVPVASAAPVKTGKKSKKESSKKDSNAFRSKEKSKKRCR